jgi:hypothetical protein
MNTATAAVNSPTQNTLKATILKIPLPHPFEGKPNAILFEHRDMLGALKAEKHATLLLENFPSIIESALKSIDKAINDLKDHNTPIEYVARDPKGFDAFCVDGLERAAMDGESFMPQYGPHDHLPENILSFAAHYDFVTNLEAQDKNLTKLLGATEQIDFMYQSEDMVRQMMSYLARHKKPMLAWDTPTHKYFVEAYLEKLALVEQLEALLCDIRKSVMPDQWGDAIIELFSQAGQVQGGKLYQTNEKEIYEERETPEARTYSRQWDQFMTQNYDRKSSSAQ